MKYISAKCIAFYLILILSSIFYSARAQSVIVGANEEEWLRNSSLMGKVEASSFSVRPIKLKITDSVAYEADSLHYATKVFTSGFLKSTSFYLLPLSVVARYNSHHPFGFNDGAMIPAKGLQTFISTGFAMELGPLGIQLKPEYVWAANNAYTGYNKDKTAAEINAYHTFYRQIDAPERFGNEAYTKIFPGQSYIKLNVGPVSLGYSTENLKWGPGRHNSLILGNNAPGFQHLTLNTNRPIRSLIGSFEGQIIGGRLNRSGFHPLPDLVPSNGANLLPNRWRYLSGINLNYQPKWVPNLYFGFTRTFMAYNDDISSFADYVPFFVRLQKYDGDQDNFPRDQRLSLYSRWVFPKANAELYFEYALNDNAYDFRDFLGSPDHGRAYLFGFSKLLPLSGQNGYLSINAEITQLSQSIDRLVRPAGSFYVHGQVSEGYTHLGQTIGAGPGTGDNVQGLNAKWFKGGKSLGLIFQRLERNVEFYEAYITDVNGMSRRWVDYSLGFTGQWLYKNFLINGKLQGVQSLNYQWRMKGYDPSMTYYVPNNDVFNLHAELGLSYRF